MHAPRLALPAALALLALAPAALLARQAGEPAAPQTFDWHLADAISPTAPWGQPVDTAASRLMRAWTTAPEFTNPHVDHLPDDPGVVSPVDHFGYPIGRPGYLHRTDEIHGYLEALAASSPRVRFLLLDETEEGNRIGLVQVGSEENLARLERVKEGMNRLADPRITSQAEADRLIAELPVVYLVYAGLHSPETGHPEMIMELAYRWAVSDDPLIREARRDVVLFIVPVLEPDGRNRMVEWYRRHGGNVYSEEDRIPRAPYWGAYVGHDNNRNSLQLNLALSQAMVDLFMEWKHPIGLDIHESVPFLYVSTGTGPYNPYIDPITVHEWHWASQDEVVALTRLGMPGVWTYDFYDGWFPGYIFWTANNRNGLGRFYETFGNSFPQTFERTVETASTSVEWFRANPPYARTMWSLRNHNNYAQTGLLHSLHWAHRNRAQILQNFWTKSVNSVERGRGQAPYAWVVPAEQPRRADAAYMVDLLHRQGIEVHRATAEGSYGDVAVRRGDFVLRMDQPYRNFVQMLMDRQRYPSEGREVAYIRGGMAWTFPLMFNVEAHPVEDPAVQALDMEAVTGPIALPGRVAASGAPAYWAVNPRASRGSLAARWALGPEVPVEAVREPLTLGGDALPPGTWLVPSADVDRDRIEAWAREFGFTVHGMAAGEAEALERHPVRTPRIGFLHTWRETRDSGAVRFALDHFGVPYTMLSEDRLGEGGLRERFDVILFPEQGRNTTGRQIFEGIDDAFGDLAYTRTDEFPTHGFPNASEKTTGGMGFEGLAGLRDFLHAGGTLVALGSAATLPVEYSLAGNVSIRRVNRLIVPGSILQATVRDRRSPLTYGYDDSLALWHKFGPYLNVPASLRGHVVAEWAPADEVFLSGVIVAPEELARQPALVSLPVGEGSLVLFAFNPMHRYQPHGNFALVWNAILHWDALGAARRLTDDDG